MAESFFAKITPVQGGPTDPGYGHPAPEPPNQIWPPPSLPPLPPGVTLPPGIWPPPVSIGGGPIVPPDWPIVIPQPPEKPSPPGLPPVAGHPLPEPPGGPSQLPIHPSLPPVVWPPLPPETGIAGKCLILVWVVGVGYRWLVYDSPEVWPTPPPVATPK